jgi:branched-chain amino acid transport system ATP-binding protein
VVAVAAVIAGSAAAAAAPATGPLLETVGLEKWFGGLRAVHDINFRLDAGEIRAIIGPNGAGKTTFVSMISGRLRPTVGRVVFRGRDVTPLPAHERVGLGIAYTFQIVSIFKHLTVYDNVALATQRRLMKQRLDALIFNPRSLVAETEAALAEVGLAAERGRPAGTLAHGHQRLLEIAMMLALRPALLILDEPTQGLAPDETAGLAALIRRIAARTTVLLIEHNVEVVLGLSQRVTVMNWGEVIAEGSPREIEANPEVQRVYLGR